MCLRYSSSVVAPTMCSSPRASLGLRMFPASIAPSLPPPAPTTVWISSTKTISSSECAVISSSTLVSRSSKSPRYRVPATMPVRSSCTIRLPRRLSGTSPSTTRWARPSTIAVLPTPASPTSTGLFLVRRERISTVCSISSARPMTGSMPPPRARSVRSTPNLSRVGVADCSCVASVAAPGCSAAWSDCAVIPAETSRPPDPVLLVGGESHEQMLRFDVGRAEGTGELVRLEKHRLDRAGEGGCGDRAAALFLRESLLHRSQDLGGIGSGAGHDRPDRVLLRHHVQDVERVEVRVTAFGGESGRGGHEFLGATAQVAGDVDTPRATRPEECRHSEAFLSDLSLSHSTNVAGRLSIPLGA